MKLRYVILGGGPTGLGAAYRLKDLGIDDYVVLEKEQEVGGLSRTLEDNQGFLWDIGGHVQFSHYPYFDEVMNAVFPASDWIFHERKSAVFMHDRLIPYPFQLNLRHLPKEVLWKCLQGLLEIRQSRAKLAPANFKEWIEQGFGRGISDTFMLPYNQKVWATPPEKMAYDWIGERVAEVDLVKVLQNVILGKDSVAWGPNNKFRFPKHGGTGGIWKKVGHLIGMDKINLGAAVEAINPKRSEIRCTNGKTYSYDRLLSTIPLDVLADLVEGLDQNTIHCAKRLSHSSTNIIGLGIKGQLRGQFSDMCWVYFPESEFPFYRMTVFSKYSPFNVPNALTDYSLMFEISESRYRPVDTKSLLATVTKCAKQIGLIPKENQIVSEWQFRTAHGYPVPTLERDQCLKQIHPVLEKYRIFSRGRFGGWKYEVSNQDHSFMQGVEWVDSMVHQQPELTYWHPSKINGPRSEKKAA